MKYSVAFASEVDSWRWAKRAEELGFHAAWFYDTQLLNPDVFICMALAAHETSRIRLGTGVLVPSNRIEPVTANAFASLAKLAPGRIDFGVGTGFTARRTMGLGAIPLKQTRTYVERVRRLLRGEVIDWDFENTERKIGFLNPDLGLIDIEHEIPVWFSAFGPKAKRVAADLDAGWLNFGAQGAEESLQETREVWTAAGKDPQALEANVFFLGAVLDGKDDDAKLMAQAAPLTAVMFHNMADEVGPMGGRNIPQGPLGNLVSAYLEVHDRYEPADARYLKNHRGHLIFVRPDETHVTPELARATTMSGTKEELVDRLRALESAGYQQVTIQLVHGHESAIEDWADVFQAL
ncbi:MAG: LLM class flavin-dependent oxidoreductase [Pseudomonadales bacterium]|nr:LLM class flavin-dependent oxidoreductase [Pseudomonadales bacterium]